jgi:hypothetical protein
MRPGRMDLNEFELTILDRLSKEQPSIRPYTRNLHVLSREYTGVGSFTNFRCDGPTSAIEKKHISLNATISMPNVPNGMGAVLFCEGGQPKCLETFTYGNDHWDGRYDGFSIGVSNQEHG